MLNHLNERNKTGSPLRQKQDLGNRKSMCCDDDVYEAPKYYSSIMENVPHVSVCCNCGKECGVYQLLKK